MPLRVRHLPAALTGLAFGVAVLTAQAPADYGPGTVIDALTVGPTTYRQATVRSVNARTVVLAHAGGLVSLRLRDLPAEWRARFRYDPEAEAAAEQAATPKSAAAAAPARRDAAPERETPFSRLLRQFGQPAALRAEVDLRASLIDLNLNVKNQGRRPSCAIFSVVSALEYQHAVRSGRPEKFSEEYLIWAVRRTTRRFPAAKDAAAAPAEEADEGFGLSEVVTALRAYGIPLQASMPNTFGSRIESIEDPPPEIVAEASRLQRIGFHALPGRDNRSRLNNLIHALNAGVPVPVGLAWPHPRTIRTGFLSRQQPVTGSGHAVTLVGYRCPTGRLEDAQFLFKNSWGREWGQGGYGVVTSEYLQLHLAEAVLLELLEK